MAESQHDSWKRMQELDKQASTEKARADNIKAELNNCKVLMYNMSQSLSSDANTLSIKSAKL